MVYTSSYPEVEVPALDLLTFLFDSPLYTPTKPETPLHADAAHPSKVITQAISRTLAGQIGHFLRSSFGIGSLGPGRDVVAVCSLGHAVLPSFFFGVVAAGGVYCPANPAASPEALARQLTDGPAKLLVCSRELGAVGAEAAELAGLARDRVLVLDSDADDDLAYPRPYLAALASAPAVKCDFAAQPELEWARLTTPSELNTPICLLYTSGTTSPEGRGRGVLISHSNMVAEAWLPAAINRAEWASWGGEPPFRIRTLGHLPPFAVSGTQGYFVNAHHDAGIVFWTRVFSLPEFIANCARLQISTFFSAVPIYEALARYLPEPAPGEGAGAPLGSVRIAHVGGTHFSAATHRAIEARLGGAVAGCFLSQTWGATELTGAATHLTARPWGEAAIGSVGMLLPGMRMRLVDLETGADLGPGEAGEALLIGPVVSQGYHNDPDANRAAFTEDGWFRTGDVLRVGRDGLVFVMGRVKEMIKTGHGPVVSPMAIEEMVRRHPAVADCAVAGIPVGSGAGDAVRAARAWVVAKPGQEATLSGEEVQEWVERQVPHRPELWLPGGVALTEMLPRHPAGKVLRRKLIAEAVGEGGGASRRGVQA